MAALGAVLICIGLGGGDMFVSRSSNHAGWMHHGADRGCVRAYGSSSSNAEDIR
jgi:hypothetical protein